MTSPAEIARLRNLGYKVTTSQFSWEAWVREQWGADWSVPYGQYFFKNGQRVFVIYNSAITGPSS